MSGSNWTVYVPILIVVIIAVFGYIATRRATAPDGWYQQINKPPLNPPNWVFGVAWAILYVLIAVTWARANYMIADVGTYDAVNWLFVINMMLNLAWSFFFFGDGNVIAGIVIIILMIGTVVALLWFLRDDVWSIVFMTIYLAWLVFALYLNIAVLMRNNITPAKYQGCPLLHF
jgi:translocator protein